MQILRWFIFVPAAFLIGAVIKIIIQYTSSIFFSEVIVNISSAVFFCSAFYISGMKIAPIKNNYSKWILLVILYILGSSIIIQWYLDQSKANLSQGITLLFTASLYATIPADQEFK